MGRQSHINAERGPAWICHLLWEIERPCDGQLRQGKRERSNAMSLWDSSAKNLLDIQQLTRGSHLRMPRKQSRSQATYPAGYGPGLRRRRRRFAAGPSELLIAGNHGVHELLPAQAGALAGRIGNQPFDGCLPFGTPFGLAVTPPPNAVRSRCSSGLIGIRETGCQKATRLGLAHT